MYVAATHRDHERGDTLIEVLIAIVVIGIVSVGSFFAISMGATNSKAQRDLVRADTVLRNYAEALKQGARAKPCSAANVGSTFTPSYPQSYNTTVGAAGLKLPADLAAAGWSISTAPTALTCPKLTDANPLNNVSQITITVAVGGGGSRVLTVDVRTP